MPIIWNQTRIKKCHPFGKRKEGGVGQAYWQKNPNPSGPLRMIKIVFFPHAGWRCSISTPFCPIIVGKIVIWMPIIWYQAQGRGRAGYNWLKIMFYALIFCALPQTHQVLVGGRGVRSVPLSAKFVGALMTYKLMSNSPTSPFHPLQIFIPSLSLEKCEPFGVLYLYLLRISSTEQWSKFMDFWAKLGLIPAKLDN